MMGWRGKFVFLLVVYFAGFATAIYCLAPAGQEQSCEFSEEIPAYSPLRSQEFAESFNSGLHKCLDIGKTAAWRAGSFIKQKLDEKQADG